MDKDQDSAVSSSSEQSEPKAEQSPQPDTKDEAATAPDTTQETPPSASSEPAREPPRIKHDWYQTHADVCVNVMIKKLRREDVRVEFGERRLKVDISLGEGQTHSLTFSLAHSIVREKSSFKVLSTKVSWLALVETLGDSECV